jgi:hypothetical protein
VTQASATADVVERYLRLGLRLGRHVDGLVDFAYGPSAPLRAEVDAEPPVEPAALAEEADRLLAADGWPAGVRGEWLRSLVHGLRVYAGVLAGEPISYFDEVEGCYGVRPTRVPEHVFAGAHEQLERLLPGPGSLAGRYEAWRAAQHVPTDRLVEVCERLFDVARERTREVVGLPEGERIEVELVSGEPWGAFNYYLGDLRSRIAVSADLPIAAADLLTLVAHEGYPGHHTEHSWKEQRLVGELGCAEESVAFVPTPSALLSEGIAEVGPEVVLDRGARAECAAILRAVVPAFDAERADAVRGAREVLSDGPVNVALLIHEDGLSRSDSVEYVMRWLLFTRERAERSVAFFTDPTWRAYATTYTDGLRLCRGFVGGDAGRFARLLTGQVTVGQLLDAQTATA